MPKKRALIAGAAIVVLLAGYATADAFDVVPGVLTTAPLPPKPPAYALPTSVPGAATATSAPTPTAATEPSTAALEKLADSTLTDGLGATGVSVVDLTTGKTVLDRDASTPRTPASITKLLTASAALHTFGPDYTTTTTAVGTGNQVILVGGGDMLLSAGAGDPNAVDGHAGLGDLAEQVAAHLTKAGTTTVTLGFDDSLFTGPTLNSMWDPDQISSGYVAPITALAVDAGRITSGQEYTARYDDPSQAAANDFATALGKHGITVTGTPTRMTAPDGATELGSVSSATLDDLVAYELQLSENTVSEVLGRLLAHQAGEPADFDHAPKAVLAALTDAGLDTQGITLEDCSGLASESSIPPAFMTDLIQFDAAPDHPEQYGILRGVPVGGLEGTLSERFTDDAGTGVVRAKTGSLYAVSSLAGVVQDTEGRQYAFAAMADHGEAISADDMRARLDAFVTGLSECGCDG